MKRAPFFAPGTVQRWQRPSLWQRLRSHLQGWAPGLGLLLAVALVLASAWLSVELAEWLDALINRSHRP